MWSMEKKKNIINNWNKLLEEISTQKNKSQLINKLFYLKNKSSKIIKKTEINPNIS